MIGLACIILTMTIFIVGLIIDYKKKDAYFVKKIYYRTVQNEIGRGEEYYFRYWVWQRYKKKYLRQILENELDITRVYSGKARKKKKYQKTRIPFLREVYGVAK